MHVIYTLSSVKALHNLHCDGITWGLTGFGGTCNLPSNLIRAWITTAPNHVTGNVCMDLKCSICRVVSVLLCFNQGSQCTYDVTWRRVRESLLLWKSNKRACACIWVPERVGVFIYVRACSLAYPTCSALAPYCIVMYSLSGCTKCSDIIHGTIFGKKKLLNVKCMFWFSLQNLFETFLILRRIQRYNVINVKTSSCKVPLFLSDFNGTWIFW